MEQNNNNNHTTNISSPLQDKTFLGLASIEFQTLYKLYLEFVSVGYAPSQITLELSQKMMSDYHMPKKISDSLSNRLLSEFSNPNYSERFFDTSIDQAHIFIRSSDYASFLERTSADPEAIPLVRSLLLSLIVYFRLNPHPSGWIKYDRKTIFYLAGITRSKLTTLQQELLTKHIHTHYNMNMRVVGSNTPTPCYNFD